METIFHPSNKISLIKLERSVKMSKHINTACLAEKKLTGNEKLSCTVSNFAHSGPGKLIKTIVLSSYCFSFSHCRF